MVKRIIILCIFVFALQSCFSQQDSQFSHEMFNQVSINPACSGLGSEIDIFGLNRQQWLGFTGAPKVTVFSISAPLAFLGINSGAGISILDDRLGFEKNFEGKLSFSYYRELRSGKLSFGIDAGLFNKTIDGDFKAIESVNNDRAIPVKGDNSMAFDMSLGVYYSTEKFYAGISSTHLLEPSIDFQVQDKPFLKRHYYLMSGYNWQVPNSAWEVRPSMMLKSDGSTFQLSGNATAFYNKRFWCGVTYRVRDAVGLLIGIELRNGIRLGYGYDIHTSALNNSHELMLGYSFSLEFEKIPQIYKSVRFL